MIELILEDRCVACNVCVRICPDDVFAAVPDAIPVIARQHDCQTCYLCELYCPVEALYVAPLMQPAATLKLAVDAEELEQRGLIGSYERLAGWKKGKPITNKPVATTTNIASSGN